MAEDKILDRFLPGRRAALKREILEHALACFNELGIEATTIDAIKTRCSALIGGPTKSFDLRNCFLP